jgi:signal transduction histidine kinase
VTTPSKDTGILHWFDRNVYRPIPILVLAVLTGWGAVILLAMGRQAGWGLAIVTTSLVGMATLRGRQLGRYRSTALQAQLVTADQRNQELDTLRELAGSLLSGREFAQLCREVAQASMYLLRAETGVVTMVVEEGRFIKVVAASGPLEQVIGALVPMDHSLVGWAVANDEPVLSADMESDLRDYQLAHAPIRLKSCAIVPLRSGGIILGTVSAYNRLDGSPFSQSDVNLLEALGDLVALGLDRASVLQDLQQSETTLRVKNLELQRATKLKSEFLANMSHELRTPLNAIIGFSDLLLTEETGPLNAQQQDFLGSVLRNGRHLLSLINSVLDLSKIEAGHEQLELVATDLREAVTGAVADTASLRAAKSQECRVQMNDEPFVAVADGHRVRQVLFNFLSNASKFTHESGHITLSVVRTTVPLPIAGTAEGSADQRRLVNREAIWISVADDGIGIKAQDITRLFTEFTQVDSSASRRQRGTGLGLALSKRFVELHGGTIGAESIHGSGSSFWFLLPVDGPGARPGDYDSSVPTSAA